MKLRPFGHSGLLVSEICLGSMTFGGQMAGWDARQAMDQFIQQGGNFIDTASGYNGGKAEEIIGQWISDGKHRPHVIIGTKGFLPEDGDPNHRRLSRHAILHSVEQSLRRLQTDYIDIYYTHYWDAYTPLEETLYALEGLVQAGKVRYTACSNYMGWQVMKSLAVQRGRGWLPFAALQAHYSLIERGIEREITALLAEEKLGLLAWSPLAGGFLTGKFSPNKPLDEKTRLGTREGVLPRYYRDLVLNERGWLILEAVQQIARAQAASPAQVALAWVLSQPFVCAAVIGISQIDHLDTNLAFAKVRLSEDELQVLDDVSRLEPSYPASMAQVSAAWL